MSKTWELLSEKITQNFACLVSLTLHIQIVSVLHPINYIFLSLQSYSPTVLIICCLRVCNSFLIYLPVTSFAVNFHIQPAPMSFTSLLELSSKCKYGHMAPFLTSFPDILG